MAKKELANIPESLDLAPLEPPPKPKLSGFLQKLFGVIKFALGLCFLPFVFAVTAAFLNEFNTIGHVSQRHFWEGVVALLLIYFFVWEPTVVYAKGQKVLEIIFMFFKPLVKVAPYLLPIYAILLFGLYWSLSFFTKGILNYFMFLFGMSMAFHLIFSAKSIRGRKEDFLKANYLFGFSFIYILNLMLAAFFLNMIFEKYSFVNFCNTSFESAQHIFSALFKQLFVV